MSIPLLRIIPAGAGSGKTYTIQTELAQWVKKGWVRPERIVAVTFTEAAAAELRDRIRAELVKEGRVEDALSLDHAYISTIHAFGLRIITEFAFEDGRSPLPRLLNDDEKDILISLALARTDRVDSVLKDLSAFGYDYDYNSGEGAEDQFRSTILGLIEKLRSVGRLEGDAGLIPYALNKIAKLYGPTRPAGELNKQLHSAVKSLLKKFPEDLSGPFWEMDEKSGKPKNASAAKELRRDFRNLKQAEKKENVERAWSLWQALRIMRVTKKGAATPAGYDQLAEAVMESANLLPLHPGPLNDARKHAEALLAGSQDALALYAEDKRDKGLVDYSDMVAIAQRILSNKDVISEFRTRIDCMVIDEFQDTNPLQFSLLWALHKAQVPTLIVGDLKQAIMGFQNADARLLEQLQKQFPAETEPLTANWRSSKPLMEWINKTGAAMFGNGYTELKPRADFPSSMVPLEVIHYPVRPGKIAVCAQYAALRIKQLLKDKSQKVFDKALRKQRRLRGGDIALLCPTHSRLAAYAAALNGVGLKTRIEQDGWFESPIIQIAYHALSFVANPGDRHAALYLSVTELGCYSLEEALKDFCCNTPLNEPCLERLRTLSLFGAEKAADVLVAETIAAMDLYSAVSLWPDAAQARANLLRFEGEAREFMGANREALASGGFYGSNLKTFLSWLKTKKDVKNGNGQPGSSVLDEDAVTLATWHSSKGREWPVVAVCATNYETAPSLPSYDVEYGNFTNLSRILNEAKISISPAFDAKETNEKFIADIRSQQQQEALRLIYVAITRAREKLILEWPDYLAAGTASYWNILTDTTNMSLKDEQLVVNGSKFKCIVTPGGKNESPDYSNSMASIDDTLPVIGRRAIKAGTVAENLTPESITPSSMHTEQGGKVKGLVTEAYGAGVELAGELPPLERGNILHRCFEILGSRDVAVEVLRRGIKYDLSEIEYASVKKAVADLRAWIDDKFSPQTVHRELPILALNQQGSVVSGVVDLIIEAKDGLWIFDHKTDTTDDFDTTFSGYYPQLCAYRDAVSQAMPGKKVLGVGINWVKYGKVSLVLYPEI